MKIVDLFRRLAFGELSNLAINKGNGVLAEEKHPQMIQYANEALLRIFSRFVLKERSLILEQTTHVMDYHLIREYAVTSDSGSVRHRYIIDTPEEPFKEDVIRILAVYEDVTGCQFPLNDIDNPQSLFTPKPSVLQIGNPKDGVRVAIVYQARHPVLDDRVGQILDQEIDVPFYLESALQNYVGYKTYCHMNGQENIIKGQEYLSAYEAICLDIEQRDLANQSVHTSHNKLEQRGFV
ncbi:hypothetical protein NKJ04_17475 [Mesorhizobium sp. M0618]|uniref:hypothetical protein n=1 Tax=Mesorhizobium sp. M0618 TaxID=2956972 RepID=UPI00333AF591